MKFCLSSRTSDKVLAQADEIKFSARDYRSIPEYISKFPDKTFIIEIPNELPEDLDWETIENYNILTGGNFYCSLSSAYMAKECKERNIKFFYKYKTSDYFELTGLKELGAAYINIGVPLFFDLPNVKKCNVPIRSTVNIAYEPYVPQSNGIKGQWIRPEDIDFYAQYIDVFEFYCPDDVDKEEKLFDIYANKKEWIGDLNYLIDNLNFSINNKMILEEEKFADHRSKCRQRCLINEGCHFCDMALKFIPKALALRDKNK